MQPTQPLSPKERENTVLLTLAANRAETKPPHLSSHHLLKASGTLSRRLGR